MTAKQTEIALRCTSGKIMYAPSIEYVLAQFNGAGRLYEVREAADGSTVLWHKGNGRIVGEFVGSARD